MRKRKGYDALIKEPEKMKRRILKELCRIAFADMEDYLYCKKDEEGNVNVICNDPDNCDMAVVSEVSQTKSGVKVKLYNKEVALGRLGTYLGMWKERPEEDIEDLGAIKERLGDVE